MTYFVHLTNKRDVALNGGSPWLEAPNAERIEQSVVPAVLFVHNDLTEELGADVSRWIVSEAVTGCSLLVGKTSQAKEEVVSTALNQLGTVPTAKWERGIATALIRYGRSPFQEETDADQTATA